MKGPKLKKITISLTVEEYEGLEILGSVRDQSASEFLKYVAKFHLHACSGLIPRLVDILKACEKD